MNPLRFPLFVLVLGLASGAWAQDFSGSEALARGKAAATGGDYTAALSHFERAAATLDGGQKADAYLWAALAAEKLGRQEQAERYKTLALAPVPAPVASERVEAKRSESREPQDTLPVEPVPVAAPAAEVKAPEAPKEEPDAFFHLFGRKGAKTPRKDRPTAAAEKAGEQQKKEEVKDKPEVDAFQYFFGRREKSEDKREKEGGAPEPSEKPPL
jgi:tetratricopeptide (TPR) repeat protein